MLFFPLVLNTESLGCDVILWPDVSGICLWNWGHIHKRGRAKVEPEVSSSLQQFLLNLR